MTTNEKWLAILRQQTTGHHSKARRVWERLSQEQRGFILQAAGLSAFLCRSAWTEFDNRELFKIKRGIQRLRSIVEMFGAIDELDFIQPTKSFTPGAAAAPQLADALMNDLLQARNQLIEPTPSH